MNHGRNHDEREQKLGLPRELEIDREVIADEESELEEGRALRKVDGSEVAPTRKAEAREHERHRLERERGRVPSSQEDDRRDHRTRDVTRQVLDEAAREADRRVGLKAPE